MTLALIPARGGSKGIPRKNIRDIAGKPLIAWTIEAALAAKGIAQVVVSTDDEEIAEIARAWGAQVPFLRPAELATDEAPGIAPVLHAVEQLPQHEALVLLQPTSPLRSVADIEAVLALGASADFVVSVTAASENPAWMYTLGPAGRLERYAALDDVTRRQDGPAIKVLNGAIYYCKTEALLRERRLVGEGTLGYEMPPRRSVDIDGLLDMKLAELLLRESNSGPTAD